MCAGRWGVSDRCWKGHMRARLLHFLLGQERMAAPAPTPQLLAQHFSPTLCSCTAKHLTGPSADNLCCIP